MLSRDKVSKFWKYCFAKSSASCGPALSTPAQTSGNAPSANNVLQEKVGSTVLKNKKVSATAMNEQRGMARTSFLYLSVESHTAAQKYSE